MSSVNLPMDAAHGHAMLRHVLEESEVFETGIPYDFADSDSVLKMILGRWERSIGKIPHVSGHGHWCVREVSGEREIDGVTVKILDLRFPVALYAQFDHHSGIFTFACDCRGESKWLTARRGRDLDEAEADRIFAELLEWWGPLVA